MAEATDRPRGSWSKRHGVWVLLLTVVLVLELAPRLSDSAADRLAPQDRLGDILRLFERHPTLMWRLRPGLDTEFQTARVQINDLALRAAEPPGPKADGSLRVLCMGESLCFGWGVALADSYSRQLQALLTDRLDRPVEVINAGTPGYTSYQGLIFLRDVGLDLQPDLVTLPYVINDLDRLRFFANDGRTDAVQQPASRLWIGLNNLSARSVTFCLYRRGLIWGISRLAGPRAEPQALGLGMQCRVPPDDYDANLRQLVTLCRDRDIPVMFVVQPLHLPLPEITGHPDAVQPTLDALYDATYDLPPALAAATADYATAQLGIAIDAARTGPEDDVATHIARSREWDAYRCRAQSILYNSRMRTLAADLDVPLADVTAAIAARPDEHLYRDEHDDPIHPNEAGHRIYAETMLGVITAEGLLSN